MAHLTLSIVEIIILLFGAIILGITIHFFIASRQNLRTTSVEAQRMAKALGEWKLKYFNDIESRDKELSTVKNQLQEAEENSNIYSIEADEMRRQNKKLQSDLEALKKPSPAGDKLDYIEQLRQAQSSLMDHNEKITQLLGQIDIIKETEEKQREIIHNNEELFSEVAELKYQAKEKDKEISNYREKEKLTKEMTSMLDNAYNEFNLLQEKIHKLETQVGSARLTNMEYEDLREEHYKLNREFEEQKIRLNAINMENQRLMAQLSDTEDKLNETNFHRQQLQKRVAYLEELNKDLQAVTQANKKLEGQIKRIGELESMLNVVEEEKDQLMRHRSDE